MLEQPAGPIGLQTPNNHLTACPKPHPTGCWLLAGLLSDSCGVPHGSAETCIIGRGWCRQLHPFGALPVPDLPCPVFCGDLPLTAGPISPWRWEARHSKCILPEAPGSGRCRSSPSLRWDTSLHWEEGLGTGVSGMLSEQGWEWDKERCWQEGHVGSGSRGGTLQISWGNTSLEPTRQHR